MRVIIPLSSKPDTTLSISKCAAAGKGYCLTLVILHGGRGIDISNKCIELGSSSSNHTISPSPCLVKLQTDPSGSFHVLPYNKSNPKTLLLAAPINTAQVNFFSPGSQRGAFCCRAFLYDSINPCTLYLSDWALYSSPLLFQN